MTRHSGCERTDVHPIACVPTGRALSLIVKVIPVGEVRSQRSIVDEREVVEVTVTRVRAGVDIPTAVTHHKESVNKSDGDVLRERERERERELTSNGSLLVNLGQPQGKLGPDFLGLRVFILHLQRPDCLGTYRTPQPQSPKVG